MSEPISNALTGEEWAQAAKSRKHSDMALLGYRGSIGIGRDHATAALALWNQPFGFTREDVRAIRYAAGHAELDADSEPNWSSNYADLARDLHSLAERIEALLPPEKE